MNRRKFLIGSACVGIIGAVPFIKRPSLIKNGEKLFISRTIRSSDYERVVLTNCFIEASPDFEGDCLFYADEDNHFVSNCVFDCWGRCNSIRYDSSLISTL